LVWRTPFRPNDQARVPRRRVSARRAPVCRWAAGLGDPRRQARGDREEAGGEAMTRWVSETVRRVDSLPSARVVVRESADIPTLFHCGVCDYSAKVWLAPGQTFMLPCRCRTVFR